MNKQFIISCIVLILKTSWSIGQIGLPLVKNYNPDEYQGGIQNWQIAQDSRGVIYVANNFGLLQYDGSDWRSYPISGVSKLRSIAMGSDGKIYAGSQDDFGYFEGDSLGSLQYYSLKHLIPSSDKAISETWKTYVLNGKVYFCTFNNIYVYDQINITVIPHDEILDESYIANNQLYTFVQNKGLFTVKGNKLSALPFSSFFSDKYVSGVIAYRPNELIITTYRKGVFIYDEFGLRPWNEKLNEQFSASFINCVTLLSDGQLAIGTQHNGIYIVDQDGNIVLNMDRDRGLPSRTILSLYEDENRNIWAGQNNGISFIKLKSPFLLANEEVNLPGTGYSALMKGNDMYFGTNNGVYKSNTKDNISQIPGTQGQVYSLQFIENQLFVGHNNGALKIINDTSTLINNNRIGSWMFLEMNEYLLKGTYEGIEILDQDELNELGRILDLEESARVIVKENDSTIWMSHIYKGIYKITIHDHDSLRSTVKYYNEDNGLPSDLFNMVHIIEGGLFISTINGLYTYDEVNDNFKFDQTLNKYFKGDQITIMKNDNFGNIYFITTQSVGFLEKLSTNNYIKHTLPFNSVRNLLNDDLPNINILSSNLVLFGAKEGFVVFDRNLFWTTENEEFSTLIRKVQYGGDTTMVLYDGDLYNPNKELDETTYFPEIPYHNNSISFYFSSTSFSTTVDPEFQFKLIGFDKDWQEWTNSNFKEYTNLKEGFYTFQVKSRNANQQIGDISHYSFTIIYPWYRSPIAYTIYVLLAMSLLAGIVISLDTKHRHEKKRLEQKRLNEILLKDAELNTIEEQSKIEINQLLNDKLASEIKHMNTELATNTMHILNKNEFINGIKSTLGDVTKKSTNAVVQKLIKGIIKDIEKNIKTDGDWEQFEIHFDKVHGDFSSRLKKEFSDLSPQEIKLSAYLRLNLSTKEIANLLNISVRGVEIGRYRLRKKLQLDRTQNLAEYILNY